MKMLEEKVPVALGEWTAGEVRMGGGGTHVMMMRVI